MILVKVLVADAALVLGIIGAVTGCFGAVIGGLAFMRDRPDLEVTAETLWPGNELSVIPALVANQGRQPVAVTAVGVAFRSPPSLLLYWLRRLSRAGRQYAEGWGTNDETDVEVPFVLDAGHVSRANIAISVWLTDEREKAVALWACAWDSRGRRSRSDRILVAPGRPYRVISAPRRSAPPFRG